MREKPSEWKCFVCSALYTKTFSDFIFIKISLHLRIHMYARALGTVISHRTEAEKATLTATEMLYHYY